MEREAALPEFKRQRPKYYYYYEWMKKRIYAQARQQGHGSGGKPGLAAMAEGSHLTRDH